MNVDCQSQCQIYSSKNQCVHVCDQHQCQFRQFSTLYILRLVIFDLLGHKAKAYNLSVKLSLVQCFITLRFA